MPEETPELPISEQETQIEAPSFLDKLKIHKFKIFGGILGIFVFTGAVFGVYKLGQRQIRIGPQPTPTPGLVAAPTPEPTADWKTYTSTKYEYSIKYPPGTNIERPSRPVSSEEVPPDVMFKYFGKKEEKESLYPKNFFVLEITVFPNSRNQSLRDFVDEKTKVEQTYILPNLKREVFEQYHIDNLSGYKVIVIGTPSHIGQENYFFFQKRDFIFRILGQFFPNTDYERVFNLMLSTFRFLE